jgi:hypothetical protein
MLIGTASATVQTNLHRTARPAATTKHYQYFGIELLRIFQTPILMAHKKNTRTVLAGQYSGLLFGKHLCRTRIYSYPIHFYYPFRPRGITLKKYRFIRLR